MYTSKKIGKDELEQYADMIPETYMVHLKANKFYAGIITDEFKTREVRMAVFITYFIDGWLELVWFGYFDEAMLPTTRVFIIYSVIMAEKKRYGDRMKGVFFEIHRDELGDYDLFRQALMMCGFQVRETPGNIYEFSLDQVKEQMFPKEEDKAKKCIPVSSADDPLKNKLDTMIRKDSRPVPVGMYVNWEDFLAEDSLICMNGDTPCGLLLLSQKGEYIILDCAYVTEKTALSAMIGSAYYNIKKKYGNTQKILIPIVLEKTGLLVEKAVPDAVRGKRLEFVKYL